MFLTISRYNVSLVSEEEGMMCDGAMMFSLSRVTSPYLYPCLVQYSLLCAGVLLTMWTRASREHEVVSIQSEPSMQVT